MEAGLSRRGGEGSSRRAGPTSEVARTHALALTLSPGHAPSTPMRHLTVTGTRCFPGLAPSLPGETDAGVDAPSPSRPSATAPAPRPEAAASGGRGGSPASPEPLPASPPPPPPARFTASRMEATHAATWLGRSMRHAPKECRVTWRNRRRGEQGGAVELGEIRGRYTQKTAAPRGGNTSGARGALWGFRGDR